MANQLPSVREDFANDIAKYQSKIMQAFPGASRDQDRVERFLRIVMNATIYQPDLLTKCTRASFFGCIMKSAQLDLEPDGLLGQAYIVPYGKTATFIIGYKGLKTLAMRTGALTRFTHDCIRVGDTFEPNKGSNARLVHIPNWREPGDIEGAYALAEYREGGDEFRIMSIGQIEDVRDRFSQAGKKKDGFSPWDTNFDAMAEKTVSRRLCRVLDFSVVERRHFDDVRRLTEAVNLDEAANEGRRQTITEEFAEDFDDLKYKGAASVDDFETKDEDAPPEPTKAELDALRTEVVELHKSAGGTNAFTIDEWAALLESIGILEDSKTPIDRIVEVAGGGQLEALKRELTKRKKK